MSLARNLANLVQSITAQTNKDVTINGVTVGKGASTVSTNTAVGVSALASNTTGDSNTAFGYQAVASITTSTNTTGVGFQALTSATGDSNTAVGKSAGRLITSGGNNTILGANALASAVTASTNTAIGGLALNATTGDSNTAVGYGAGYSNTSAVNSTFVGYQAGYYNTAQRQTFLGYQAGRGANGSATGAENVAVGRYALFNFSSGGSNVAVGHEALYTDATGSFNTAVGYQAGYYTTGTLNSFFGNGSGANATGSYNSFFGEQSGYAITSGAKNTIIGRYTGNQGGLDIRTASNYVVLSDGDGNPQIVSDATGNIRFRLGQTNFGAGGFAIEYDSSSVFLQSYASKPLIINNLGNAIRMPQVYSGYTNANAANMYIGTDGTLYRSTSSLKYKTDVQDATFGLADVMKLRAVTYKQTPAQAKDDLGELFVEQQNERVFAGLIAEEVHEAGLTQFVQYAEDGTPDALSYGNMVSLCIKAIQELKAEIDALKGAA